jgi:hypothetical protein
VPAAGGRRALPAILDVALHPGLQALAPGLGLADDLLAPKTGPVSERRVCASCEEPLHGRYCHECGQLQSESTGPLRQIFQELWETFINVDRKLFLTLKLLFLKPGFLSQEYLSNRIARYISPFKLLFWSAAIVAALSGKVFYVDSNNLEMQDDGIYFRRDIVTKSGKIDNNQYSGLHVIGIPTMGTPYRWFGVSDSDANALPDTVAEFETRKSPLNPWQRFLRIQTIHWRNSTPNIIQNLLYGTLPTILFIVIPLWALCIKAFYPKKLYIEHLVFSMHCHVFGIYTFMFFSTLSKFLPGEWVNISILGGPLFLIIYGFLAARSFYGGMLRSRIWKGMFISTIYLFLFIAAILLGIVGTAAWLFLTV